MPIDLRHHPRAWDAALKPEGEDTFEKEEFEPWWSRNQDRLSNLHPVLAEQWVYRHWTETPYYHLPLEYLSWRLETWPTDRLLSVGSGWPEMHPDHDYEVFHYRCMEPAITMDATGTWDYPVVVL